jgi:hypothetical protein
LRFSRNADIASFASGEESRSVKIFVSSRMVSVRPWP